MATELALHRLSDALCVTRVALPTRAGAAAAAKALVVVLESIETESEDQEEMEQLVGLTVAPGGEASYVLREQDDAVLRHALST